MRTTSSPRISALNEQPTTHDAQVVTTECSGWPISMMDFSVSVAVGQACTQAPQDTHSEPRKLSLMPGETRLSKPRPEMVSAKVPCTSSQARTQREQTMHFDGSYVKYGLDSSFGIQAALAAPPDLAKT